MPSNLNDYPQFWPGVVAAVLVLVTCIGTFFATRSRKN